MKTVADDPIEDLSDCERTLLLKVLCALRYGRERSWLDACRSAEATGRSEPTLEHYRMDEIKRLAHRLGGQALHWTQWTEPLRSSAGADCHFCEGCMMSEATRGSSSEDRAKQSRARRKISIADLIQALGLPPDSQYMGDVIHNPDQDDYLATKIACVLTSDRRERRCASWTMSKPAG